MLLLSVFFERESLLIKFCVARSPGERVFECSEAKRTFVTTSRYGDTDHSTVYPSFSAAIQRRDRYVPAGYV